MPRIVASPSRALAAAAVGALLAFGPVHSAQAQTVSVTDVAGRTVEVPSDVKRVILGEGRLIYVIAALEPENPFARVAGWNDDLRRTDLSVYRQYAEKFPEVESIQVTGDPTSGEFSAETAISANPDVILMTERNAKMTEQGGLIEQLAAADIATVFVDFRDDIPGATVPSIRILGKVLGREDRAEELIAFYEEQMAKVTEPLSRYQGTHPKVFIERTAGLRNVECCRSFGNNNMGWLVATAGGDSIAAGLIPGATGTINPEQMLATDPEVYVASGSNWSLLDTDPNSKFVSLGSGADPEVARQKLGGLTDRQVMAQISAVKNGRVHAIWHQFYTSPYHFAAVQSMAKWFHPDLFADLDPAANFREFHERFLPIEYRGGYWASLND